MCIGKARALEIGHRVDLTPDDVVEDPEALILQHRSDAEDVVIAANHPKRAIGLQNAPGFSQPGLRKGVIGLQAVKLVPVIIHGINAPAFGTIKVAAQLKIIGRIGKNHVDARIGQRPHRSDAVAHNDLVERQVYGLNLGLTNLLHDAHRTLLFTVERPW